MRNVLAMFLFLALLVLVILTVCAMLTFCSSFPSRQSEWARRDISLRGMERVVVYTLNGPADSDREINIATQRGVNSSAPFPQIESAFSRVSGTKVQDVRIVQPDGTMTNSLSMIKVARFAGLTRSMRVEAATYVGTDSKNNRLCGVRVRLSFARNLIEQADPNKLDYDSLWYYTVPCWEKDKTVVLDIEKASFYALVINEVWQFRIATGPVFFNWGNSVTVVGGAPARLKGGWWEIWESPDGNDVNSAAALVNQMVNNLELNNQGGWVRFGEEFSDSCIIYSAGDADRYATVNRLFLNRQEAYAVLYRKNCHEPWRQIVIVPKYNMEWNDVAQNLSAIRGWSGNPFEGRLSPEGTPRDPNDSVVIEIERRGFANAPNSDLDQIVLCRPSQENLCEQVLYHMTVRAHIGATDSLIIFGRVVPELQEVRSLVPPESPPPRPVYFDERGNPLPPEKQPYTDEQWAEWWREATMWNFMAENPYQIGADLIVQYRFSDDSTWEPIFCQGSTDVYICGYRPIEWHLSATYYTKGDVFTPWTIMQTLGEVGVRSLGLSYASERFKGTGLLFAMAQEVYRQEYWQGYTSPESLWIFDARALQLPGTLERAFALMESR